MHCMPKIGGHEITSTHYTFYNAIIISLYQSSCNLVSKRLTRTECMYMKVQLIPLLFTRINSIHFYTKIGIYIYIYIYIYMAVL